jgi:NAD(P)-dependent dehydrogenase (short-subunit alcohol dehydrogenase family)
VHAKRADVLHPAQLDAVVASVAHEFGAIDIPVNAVRSSAIIPRPSATLHFQPFARPWIKQGINRFQTLSLVPGGQR